MRIVVMGTGPFAVPTFESLLASDHQVAALVTRPPRPVHGKRSVVANPMQAVAERHPLPILAPENVNDPQSIAELAQLQPEVLVVCDYGQILAPQTLAVAPRGGINLHGSLLPRYRGAAPVNWAIYHGETETGITVIHMTPRLDAGPCLLQRRLAIGADETAEQLEPRLARLGVEAVHESLAMLAQWDGQSPLGTVQDPQQATRAPRLKKAHGHIDWRRSARAISNQVRAFKPWPGTFTQWKRAGRQPLRLIVDQVQVDTEDGPSEAPGQVLSADAAGICVACGEGRLRILRIQPAGKRLMTADEFLRGYPLQAGQSLD